MRAKIAICLEQAEIFKKKRLFVISGILQGMAAEYMVIAFYANGGAL